MPHYTPEPELDSPWDVFAGRVEPRLGQVGARPPLTLGLGFLSGFGKGKRVTVRVTLNVL